MDTPLLSEGNAAASSFTTTVDISNVNKDKVPSTLPEIIKDLLCKNPSKLLRDFTKFRAAVVHHPHCKRFCLEINMKTYENKSIYQINDYIIDLHSLSTKVIICNKRTQKMVVADLIGKSDANDDMIFSLVEDTSSAIVFDQIIDLNEEGRRWEGCSKDGKPYGYGREYDEDNNLEFEGFVYEYDYFIGKSKYRVGYGIEYYPDLNMIEYEGFYVDNHHFYGINYDRNGDISLEGYQPIHNDSDNHDSSKSPWISCLNRTINIPNEFDFSITHFELSFLNSITTINIGEHCCPNANTVVFNNLPDVKAITIDAFSFGKCTSVSFKNLPSLETITFMSNSCNGDPDNTRFGNPAYYQNYLHFENLPSLHTLSFGTKTFFNFGKVTIKNVPQRVNVTVQPDSFTSLQRIISDKKSDQLRTVLSNLLNTYDHLMADKSVYTAAAEKQTSSREAMTTINFCLCIWSLVSMAILVLLGDSMLSRRLDRSSAMREYNRRAQVWVDQGMNSFQGAHFAVNDTTLEMKRDIGGEYYPVRDSCDGLLDPKEGCVYTEALYYQTIIENTAENEVTVNFSSEEMNSGSVTVNSTALALYCTGDLKDDESDCDWKCNKLKGTIKRDRLHYYCIITLHLFEICIRVSRNNITNQYQLDNPPKWPLTNNAGIGCYYNNNYNPATYSIGKPSNVTIIVRSYQDSFISANQLTQGCSFTNINANYCLTGYSTFDFIAKVFWAYCIPVLLLYCCGLSS